jgi:pantoate kinase
MTTTAGAFVPGHVTGFFTVERDGTDPTKSGSTGAGIALAEGVEVRVTPGGERAVTLDGDPVEVEAVDRVLRTLDADATVRAETDLPVGAGFGVSGAMALGTALAANVAFDRRLSVNELVTIAHGAEVEAGTGLGDVVAQARGGVTVRLEPGGPHENVLDGIVASRRVRVEYVHLGEIATGEVIGGDTDALDDAGETALSRVVEEPTLSSFMYASRAFAREAALLTPAVREAIQAVSEAGGQASMAMLGETVFALGTGLSDAGYDPAVTRVHTPGAVVL